MKFSFLFAISIIFLSCENNEKVDQYSHIPFLHQIKETNNYEIIPLNFYAHNLMYDSVAKNFIFETLSKYYKYSLNGKPIDSLNSDGVLIIDNIYTFGGDKYTSWIENGDKKIKYFINITPKIKPEGRDTLFYKEKHIEFYNKSTYVKYGVGESDCYYLYNYKWYRLSNWGGRNLKKRYPEKLPPVRMKSIALNPNPPDYVKQFYVPRKKVNSISDAVGAPKDFTLGTYIIRVGLPGGDSLVYRRFGDGLGNLSTFYQKPSSEGGNDSIIFIEQDYHNNKMIDGGTYFSHGGLFMIRPKRKK